MTMCKFLPLLHRSYMMIVSIIKTVISKKMRSGQEKISLARTLQATRSASGNARWEAVGLFVFFVAVAVYSGRTARR